MKGSNQAGDYYFGGTRGITSFPGTALALWDGTLVVGAPGERSCKTTVTMTPPADENSCMNSGAVYVFAPPCSIGEYADTSLSANYCIACPPGTVQPIAGYLPCTDCSVGEQQPLDVTIARFKRNWASDVRVCWSIWVPCELFYFGALPLHWQVPFAALASFFYTAILSYRRGEAKKAQDQK